MLKLRITSIIILSQALTLSWACRVYKVQGLSLNSAFIRFDLEKPNLFSQGRMYVALSHITDIKELPYFLELVLTNTSNLSIENFVNRQFHKSVLFV